MVCTLGLTSCHRSNPPAQRATGEHVVPLPSPPIASAPATPAPSAPSAQAPIPSNGALLTPSPRREVAIAALSLGPIAPEELSGRTAIDIDGDAQADAVVTHEDHCVLIRQNPGGITAELLAPETADQSVQCLPLFALHGRTLVPVVATGHETDNGRSETWTSIALFAATPMHAAVNVWEHRVPTNNGDDAVASAFVPLPDGTLAASSSLGDDRPAGASGSFHAVLRWNGAQNRFDQISCWQPTRPTASPAAMPGCTGTPGASFHLRVAEQLEAPRSSAEFPAGTRLTVLAPGTLTRGEARLHCVSTPSGDVGYAFLTASELSGCGN